MTIVCRYLLLRALGPTLVALLLLMGLVFMLQVMRLGHHVLGAGLGVGFLGRLLLFSLPTLLVFALPLALASGLADALGRLGQTNQLLALRLAGASPLQLAGGGVGLSLLAALALLVTAQLEPAALSQLSRALRQGASRVLLWGPRPGSFMTLTPGTTLYVQRRLPAPASQARFEGFLLARDGQGSVVLAARATLRLQKDGRTMLLQLEQGELQEKNRSGGLRRVRFSSLRWSLDLEPMLRRHLGFLTQLGARPERALLAPLSCLALGLLVTALGLGRFGGGRLRLAGAALLGVALFQAGSWGAELLLSPVWGSGLLSGGVMVGSLVALYRSGR